MTALAAILHWLSTNGPILIAAAIPLLSVINGLLPHRSSGLDKALDALSILTRKNSPGTLKWPLALSAAPTDSAPARTDSHISDGSTQFALLLVALPFLGAWSGDIDALSALVLLAGVVSLVLGVQAVRLWRRGLLAALALVLAGGAAVSACTPAQTTGWKVYGGNVKACATGALPAPLASFGGDVFHILATDTSVAAVDADLANVGKADGIVLGVDALKCLVTAAIATAAHPTFALAPGVSGGNPIVVQANGEAWLAMHGGGR